MIQPAQVFAAVAAAFGVPDDFCRSRSRTQWMAMARFAAWHIMREKIRHISLEHIGSISGKRDHTSIVHGNRRACELLENDREFQEAYKQAITNLRGMEPPSHITTIYT